jgi:class 3 adenylate cyclase
MRGRAGSEVRAVLHTGEVETIAGKVGGLAVVIGAQVGALAGPSEVLTSQTIKDLTAGSGLAFENAGEHELRGVPDRWRLYRVTALESRTRSVPQTTGRPNVTIFRGVLKNSRAVRPRLLGSRVLEPLNGGVD